VHVNAPVRILRNRQPPRNFVSIRLRATAGARNAVGARVTLADVAARSRARFVVSGAGYASHSDDRIIYPLQAGAESADVVVRWPGRATEMFRGLPVRRTSVLVEGRGERHEQQ
jgi:hypothetical protein